MANLGTRLYTWLRGHEVGRDEFGNRYFREKGGGKVHKDSLRKERRWVIFAEEDEATRVPPEWHGWLHHTVKEAPPVGGIARAAWMQPHRPNPTGTDQAYRPPGHVLQGGERAKATGDYEAWTPE